MTDDDFDKIDNNEDFADEFDFIEEGDQVATPENHTEAGPPRSSGSPVTKIIIGASAIVLLGGGYLGYTHFMSGPKPPAEIAETAPLPPPAAPEPATDTASVDFNTQTTSPTDDLAQALPPQAKTFEQVQQEMQASAPTPPPPAQTINQDAINATLDSISEEMTLNVNQIKNLEATITSLAGTLDQLNKSISAMDNRVLGLTETVDGLVQDLSNVKKLMADEDIDLTNSNSVKLTKNKTASLNSSNPDYSVHAIIPGRAWLKSSSGQIITVTEGDKVGDYGTVAVIDAANGVVRTSSGITFR